MFHDHSDIDPRFPPRRLVYSQLLVRDEHGHVLLVSDNLRDNKAWNLLTWRARKDEPPHDAAVQAAHYEVGLDLDTTTLLVVDAVTAREDSTEALWFVFDGGTRTDTALDGLPEPGEMEDNLRFEDPEDIPLYCLESHQRIQRALDRITDPFAPIYLTNGHPPAATSYGVRG
ncbi:NUDIX hydrolase [Kitasatospora purpeofusca]|uniref:NUDIX hydrolase n=1 Tax=Kitasatospora purpeofusca TaxID=67352 RepID=UPI0034009832